ncbi:hypothetical protein O6H91_04G064800 [Diphasiastrum complanatum]|nr:hypothetical protein O6H91_04G064800 [Diphasiastrum complanatum]
MVDSHRPIHLNNLSDQNKQVIVLYTEEDERQADMAYDFDIATLANFSDLIGNDDDYDDEVDTESEDESDDDDESIEGRRKRRKGEDDDGDEGVEEARKEMKKKKLEYYKRGTFYGRPAGCLMFEIAHSLHKNTNELLWLACVALTDQFVHERLTTERYQAGVMELEQHVNSAGNLEMVTSVTLKDGTVVRAPDVSRITYEDEPRLMLLREWTLYESMLCSSYVATKLKTWSDGGVKRLRLLLANMGIALVECQQKFQYMSSDTKKGFKTEFEKFSSDYGLTELYYRSFQRLHGYSAKVSAADVVYGVTALLESWGENKNAWSDQFWKAYSALSPGNWQNLQQGMLQAIKVQRAAVRQGSLAITKQGFIKSGRGFRWLKLEEGPDTELLAHPMSLIKFCYFLMDALREQGARMKPMICAAKCPGSAMVLVVGVSHRPHLGAQRGNRFGAVFRTVAENLGVSFQLDGFDTSWIQLDAAAVGAFMMRISEKL